MITVGQNKQVKNKVKLLAIGTALPPGLFPQKEAFSFAKTYNCTSEREERILQRLYQRTFIDTRSTIFSPPREAMSYFYSPARQPGTGARMQRYEEEVGPLALRAAQKALGRANLEPTQISNLVTVSCTGFFAPGMDTQLIEGLALDRQVSRTHVGFMGCHGAMNGLRAASALAKESRSISLVVAAELCSLHFQYGQKTDSLLANALFADGAAAAILSAESDNTEESMLAETLGREGWKTDQTNRGLNGTEKSQEKSGDYSLMASGSYVLPDSRDAMTWKISDDGFVMTLGAQVPDLIKDNLSPWVNQWLAKYDLDVESVASWAVHPGGPRILDAAQAGLNLNAQALAASRHIFSNLGNMSSPTILFIIERMIAENAPTPLVALAFGPGLTVEAALIV